MGWSENEICVVVNSIRVTEPERSVVFLGLCVAVGLRKYYIEDTETCVCSV